MRLHKTLRYKDYVIMIYQVYSDYKAIICNKHNDCSHLLSLHQTEFEAIDFAKKRIDVDN